MVVSEYRGHKIELRNETWFYCDKNISVKSIKKTPCGYCGQPVTKEGHDGCLETLPGLMNACCGHGIKEQAYVQFLDGFCVQGKDACSIIGMLKELRY